MNLGISKVERINYYFPICRLTAPLVRRVAALGLLSKQRKGKGGRVRKKGKSVKGCQFMGEFAAGSNAISPPLSQTALETVNLDNPNIFQKNIFSIYF